MSIEFNYTCIPSWPPLAWLAICKSRSDSIQVLHGSGIERCEDWFCEAVWDNPFGQGDFDLTDLVFGSGGRRRQGAITFVSSGSTVDRLQYSIDLDRTFISNSLPCLLEAIEGRLDASLRGYVRLFGAIKKGINDPHPELPLSGGSVQLVYFHNLLWNGMHLQEVDKPKEKRNFDSFDDYVGFVRSSLQRIGENLRSRERARSYSWLGTISSGYDSPACITLARYAGLTRVVTIDESRPGIRENGATVSSAIGVDCTVVSRCAWKTRPPLEPIFLAADAQGKEVLFAGAGPELENTVLVTGYAGGAAWAMSPKPLGENLARNNYSGLSLTEYRLHRGFIHLPVPFIGLRQLPDLVKLSRSASMSSWDTGGKYSRPISRRIVEEAGVPRDGFGCTKVGASTRFLIGEDSWSEHGRRDFLNWVATRRRVFGIGSYTLIEARICFFALEMMLGWRRSSIFEKATKRITHRLASRIRHQGLHDLAFVWAIECVRKLYRLPPGN